MEDRAKVERALASFRRTLDSVPVVGLAQGRDTELAELERLIRTYPDEARQILDALKKTR